MVGPALGLLAGGRAALLAGDGETASRSFERVLESAGDDESTQDLRGPALEGLAAASYLSFAFARSIEQWEQAYCEYRRRGDGVGAVRAART